MTAPQPGTLAGAPEGSVAVRLSIADGRVGAVSVAVRRPDAARALAGRTAADAARLVPLLFSLCGTAQAIAFAQAAETALGMDAAAHADARALLVAAETTGSHGWQALMDWPARLGEPPQPRALVPLRAALSAIAPALYPGRDALALGGGGLRPDAPRLHRALADVGEAVREAVFGGEMPGDSDALQGWADRGATPAARLMRRALTDAGFGACAVEPLGAHPAAWFGERLAHSTAFSSSPHQNGAPAHTGPLARHAAHPMVAALMARHGAGVAAHAAARLVELAGLPGRMAALAAGLKPADPAKPDGTGGAGTGSGAVDTARGRLAHWVRVEDGRIAECRTVAPTEWNFAADGPFARGLAGAVADDRLAERAGLLAAVLDPCVACTIALDREE